MPELRYRTLIICSHPVQYMSPLLRRMARHPQIDLLDAYNWVEIANIGTGTEAFLGLCNPDLWRVIRRGNFDAVLCHTGYLRASFWIAFLASRLSNSVFLFGTDANSLAPRDSLSWKVTLKRVLWPRIFSLA